MYRVSPLTYWVGGIVATMLHGRFINCAQHELAMFNPPAGMTCGQYMGPYLKFAPGQLLNPTAFELCQYCPLTSADQFLVSSDLNWNQRWRDFGFMWIYVAFNISIAVFLYYLVRVRKWSKADMVRSIKALVRGRARD